MGPSVRDVAALRDLDVDEYGAAAVQLGRLAGFPTLPTIAIGRSEMREHLRAAGLSRRAQAVVDGAPADGVPLSVRYELLFALRYALRPDFAAALGSAAGAIRAGEAGYDVRVSGTSAADVPVRRAVTTGSLPAAVRACWSAAADPLMMKSVIVSRAFSPAFTGTCRTAAPAGREVVIDASAGYDGVRWPAAPGIWQIAFDRDGRALRQAGPMARPLPGAMARVAEIARDVERAFGAPQEVSWAVAGGDIFVLGTRPSTDGAALLAA